MHAFQLPSSYHALPFDASQADHAAKRENGTATRGRQHAQDDMHNVITSPTASSRDDTEDTPTTSAGGDSTFLTTPKHPGDTSGMSSFIFPSRSYDVQQISNIRDMIPEWEDDEIDEIVVLSEKQRELDSIDESQELSESESGTSIHAFEPLELLSSASVSASTTTSTVALFKHVPSSSLYAVKTFTKSSISYDTPTLEHAMKEQMILRLLTQMEIPYILQLRWSFQDVESMRLVTEYSPGGDLLARVSQHGPLNSSLAWLYAAELAEALSSLHSSGICHRSLRPEHILIGADGHIVLTGFSRASVTVFNSPKSEHKVAFEEKERLARAANIWSASEVILGWAHDFAVDCWGFGLIVYFMLTGRHPFLLEHKPAEGVTVHPRVLESAILHGPVQLRGWENDDELRDLVTKCVERNPRMRLTIEDIKDHAYFADVVWTRIREKGYPAPAPAQTTAESSVDDSVIDSLGIQESETLHGVHIAGFDYAHDPDSRTERIDLVGDESLQDQDQDVSVELSADSESNTLEDLSVKATNVLGESTYATPSDSVNSLKAESATTASTALYSCTSFGELRDALKARPSEKFSLPLYADPDLQSNAADISHLDVHPSNVASRRESDINEPTPSRPTSAMLRQDSEVLTSRPSSGLGARGLGLRKYASLDFELDTVVSLEPDLERSRNFKNLGTSGLLNSRAGAGNSKRRVSFAEALASTSPADTLFPDSATLGAPTSPWRNLSKIYSPNQNVSKLRKRRTESTPVLSATPNLQAKADLPDGLQQIGLGIGYNHASAAKNKPGLDTPRRSISLGTGVAKCTALLSNIRRGKVGQDAATPDTGRASEESDAMEAVMREMYGSAWNADMGIGYLGGGGYAQAASSRRHAGKVYSVEGGVDEMGSTLRLVQTPNAVDPFQ